MILEAHMVDLKSDLHHRCLYVLNRRGITNFNDINVDVQSPDKLQGDILAAYIKLDDKQIHIIVAENYSDALARMIEEEKLTRIPSQITDDVVELLVTHEHGHHRICPKTPEGFEAIIKGIDEEISGREIRQANIEFLCGRISNMFEDTLLNTVTSTEPESESFRNGLGLTYLLRHNCQRALMKPLGFWQRFMTPSDKSFAVFLDSSMLLCDVPPELRAAIRKYQSKFILGFSRYVRKVVDVYTGDKTLTRMILDGKDIGGNARLDLAQRLQDMGSWKQMAKDYAAIMYPLMKPRETWQDKMVEKRSDSKPSSSKPCDKSKAPVPSDVPKTDMPYSGFEKIRDMFASDDGSHWLTYFRRLDQMYRERARRMAIFAESEESSPNYERATSTEEILPQDFSPKGIDWAATRVRKGADGRVQNINFYKRGFPIHLNIPAKDTPGGIPDLGFIFDSSASDGFDPFNPDEAKKGGYDLACLQFHCVLAYLESIGLAPLMNFNMINFSNYTKTSGWRSYDQIRQVQETMYAHQNGATVMDPKIIRQMVDERRDNFIAFMLSDTDFNFDRNAQEIVREVDRLLESGAGFYVYKLGHMNTEFATQMRRRRVGMREIESVADFMNLSLKFTKDLYGEVVA